MSDRFRLGQIVVSDFSGPKRHVYDTENFSSSLPERSKDVFINKDEICVVLESQGESKNFLWLKLLTSSGTIGYVPSIWVRSIDN